MALATTTSGFDSTATYSGTNLLPSFPTTSGLDASDRTFVISADDSAVGLFWAVDLYSSNSTCRPGSTSPDCLVSCSPHSSPNVASPSCISTAWNSTFRPETEASVGDLYWIDATNEMTDNNDGTYTVGFTPETTGDYDVEISLLTEGGLLGHYYNNVWFKDAPFQSRVDASINFQWGTGVVTDFGVDYVSIRWEGKVRPDYTEKHTIYSFADDGMRVWLDNRLIIDSWAGPCCNETWASVDLVKNHFHDIVVEYFENRDSATAEVRWSSAHVAKQIIPGRNFFHKEAMDAGNYENKITIDPGPAWHTTTTVTGDGLSKAIAGADATIYWEARDVFGNSLNSDSAELDLAVVNSDVTAQSVTWVSDGSYTMNYTIEKSSYLTFNKDGQGNYSVALEVSSSAILASPTLVWVSPGDTDADTSLVNGPGIAAGEVGFASRFTITPRDTWFNQREVGDDKVFLQATGVGGTTAGLSTIGSVVWNEDLWHYDALYTASASGDYLLTVFLNNDQVMGPEAGGEWALTQVPSSPAYSKCTLVDISSGLTAAVVDIDSSFIIEIRDQFGNLVDSQYPLTSVNVVATGPNLGGVGTSTITGTVVQDSDFQYTATYKPKFKGKHTFQVYLNGDVTQQVAGSPFEVDVTFGANVATQSIFTSAATGKVNEDYVVYIQSKDINDNIIIDDAGTLNWEASLTYPEDTATTSTSVYLGAGRYSVTIVPLKRTTTTLATLTVTETTTNSLATSDLAGATPGGPRPIGVQIFPADANAGSSVAAGQWLDSNPGGTVDIASGFIITARDDQNNLVGTGGFKYSVNVTKDGVVDVVPVVDNNDGTYSVSYSPKSPGNHRTDITLELSGGLLASYHRNTFLQDLNPIVQVDKTVDFDWKQESPLPSASFSSDYFSVEWVGFISVPASATYTLYTDIGPLSGVRLFVNHKLVIDDWDHLQGDTEVWAKVAMEAGTRYPVTLHYKEWSGNSRIRLLWESAFQAKEVVPKEHLFYQRKVASSPYTSDVDYAPAVAATTTHTFVAGQYTALLPAENDYVFQVQARDARGNELLTHSASPNADYSAVMTCIKDGNTVTVTGTTANSVVINTDVVYDVSFKPTIACDYTFEIKYNNVHIAGSPTKLTVVPAVASAPHMLHTPNCQDNDPDTPGDGILRGDSEVVTPFTVQTVDEYSNLQLSDVALCGAKGADKSQCKIHAWLLWDQDGSRDFTVWPVVPHANDVKGDVWYSSTGTGYYEGTFLPTINGNYAYRIYYEEVTPTALSFNVGSSFTAKACTDMVVNPAKVVPTKSHSPDLDSLTTGGTVPGAVSSATASFSVQTQDRFSTDRTIFYPVTPPVFYDTDTHPYDVNHLYVEADDHNGIIIRDNAVAVGTNDGEQSFDVTFPHTGEWTLSVKVAVDHGLTGSYYNNRWLDGAADMIRIDPQVDFDWGVGLITEHARDFVSVSWAGHVRPEFADDYTFSVTGDDGFRLEVDGILVIDNWNGVTGSSTKTGSFVFPKAERLYTIKLDYRDNTDAASISLSWEAAGSALAPQIIPAARLHATSGHIKNSPYTIDAQF